MGRPTVNLDTETVYDLATRGLNQKQMASELGISIPTLSRRIADIQEKQGLLLQYRTLQSLQLTELQARILEHITPEKIEQADLKDLIVAFKILKDKELVVEGKPTEVKGLISYLIQIEKEEIALEKPVDAELFEEVKETSKEITNKEYIPEL